MSRPTVARYSLTAGEVVDAQGNDGHGAVVGLVNRAAESANGWFACTLSGDRYDARRDRRSYHDTSQAALAWVIATFADIDIRASLVAASGTHDRVRDLAPVSGGEHPSHSDWSTENKRIHAAAREALAAALRDGTCADDGTATYADALVHAAANPPSHSDQAIDAAPESRPAYDTIKVSEGVDIELLPQRSGAVVILYPNPWVGSFVLGELGRTAPAAEVRADSSWQHTVHAVALDAYAHACDLVYMTETAAALRRIAR
jgi:hypothetical protein